MPLMPSTPLLPSSDELDAITNLLLERETPMTTLELARWLIETRQESERQELETRYQDIKVYDPSQVYQVGDRLAFSRMEYALATVADIRPGNNAEYGPFEVVSVEFDEALYNGPRGLRHFAARLGQPHALSGAPAPHAPEISQLSPDEVLKAHPLFLKELETALGVSKDLRRVAGYWFPQELVMPVDVGMLHLAEAVLDVNGEQPMTTQQIVEQIGGLGSAPMSLQVFSMNVAMSQDKRFDEVGPLGQVLWYLHRQQPEDVRRPPIWLQHRAIDFDPTLLSAAMQEFEQELNDELSKLPPLAEQDEATVYLIYPHRRAGTLPINRAVRAVVPTARTPRIYVEIVDEIGDKRFPGWIVHEHQYIYGLLDYYTEHRLSIGTRLYLSRGDHAGQLRLRYDAYKARREFIPVIQATRDHLTLMQTQRSIGAEFDMQLIVGIDNLEATDELARAFSNKSLATILKAIIGEAGKFSPQSAVHAKTIYSLANVFRRVPPGLVFATLAANPDFQAVGDMLWKLNE